MRIKREVIVAVDKALTARERKNFAKEHPGYRLCFRLRHPHFPEFILTVSALLLLLKPVLPDMLRWLQKLLLQL